jgi:hypothetical protein
MPYWDEDQMTTDGKAESSKLAAKDYLALGFSALALIVSGAGFYVQFIEKKYGLYVNISDVQISLATPSRPAAIFLFSNRGNQQAIIMKLAADIYPASESFGTDNCKLRQIQRVASLTWTSLGTETGVLKAGPIVLKPNEITAYNVEFGDFTEKTKARAVSAGHGNQFLLACWSMTYYSRADFPIIQHFAATVSGFNDLDDLQEQRTPTSLIFLKQ